jgi:CIC family chloride channel protein
LEIPIQTQIQFSHRVAEAVLETVRDQRIELLVLGWSGKTGETELFNRTVGALIEQAPCDLLLVKAGEAAGAYPQGLASGKPWLVPFAGGPNVERALDFLPALLSLYPQSERPEILLTTVYDPHQKGGADPELLKSAAENLAQRLSQPVVPLPLCLVSLPGQENRSVGEELVSVAQTYDCGAILIGASREGLLSTLLRDNLPHFLATRTSAAVLVFRSALEEG